MRQPKEHEALVNHIKALAQALEDSDVSELDITEDGLRIALRRRLDAPPTASYAHMPVARALRERPEPLGVGRSPDPDVAVVAPLTGVFYLASSPSVPPFVEVGSPVQAGEVVCIVEAMKVFNEIRCEIAGMVSAIIAQNGQLVQRGDALIRIKPL